MISQTFRSLSLSSSLVRPITLALAAAALATACAGSRAPAPRADASLYERLGGDAGISAMVDDAIVNIATDPRINHRFSAAGGPELKRNLVDLVCERTGGPCVYRGKNMADAHEGMHIGDAEFDALVADMVRAMDKHHVAPREKAEAIAILAKMKNAIVGH